MKKTVLFVFLLLGSKLFAQKPKFEEVKVKSIAYPETPLPADFKTYTVKLEAQNSWVLPLKLTVEGLKNSVKFDSFQYADSQADLNVEIKLKKTDSKSEPVNVDIELTYEVFDRQGRLMKKGTDKQSLYYGSGYQGSSKDSPQVAEAVKSIVARACNDIKIAYDYRVVQNLTYLAHLKKDNEATYDYTGFETAYADVKGAIADYVWNPNNQSLKKDIQSAIEFWDTQKDKIKLDDKEQRKLYFVCTYNLALVHSLLYNITEAENYAALMDKSDVKDMWGNFMKKEILESRKEWKLRHDKFKKELENGTASLYRSSSTAPVDENRNTVRAILGKSTENTAQNKLDQQAILKGYVVTAQDDTLHGEILDVDVNILKKQVVFIETGKTKRIFAASDLDSFSAGGALYKTVGSAIFRQYYKSPNIEFVYVPAANIWLFGFNNGTEVGEYPYFDANDGASYVVNYKKKMADIFKKCPDVVKKINAGSYTLKTTKAEDLLKIVQDYEASCGSGNFEKYNKQSSPEQLGALYH